MAMQHHGLQAVENKLMLIGILLFTCAWYVGTEEYNKSLPVVAWDLFSILLLASIQWLTARSVLAYLRKKHPHYAKTLTRVALAVLSSGLSGMCLSFLVFEVPKKILENRPFTLNSFAVHFGPMFFYSALVIGAHEVLYNFYELRRIDREREELKKAQLQSQLDSLKTQVNPHFLFNSLNSILSLIRTSPAKAEAFTLELSSVYRYLLQANENQLTTLREELQFTRSYFHLLKTRFGNAIHLDEQIDEQLLDYRLPSLTLQLLLENAVKHNVVALSKPLTIRLCTQKNEVNDQSFLSVQNNLQPKPQPVLSNRMGLNNILSKFRLLNQEEVVITDKDDCFTVVVPLIKKPL
jgi:hypothetical protein